MLVVEPVRTEDAAGVAEVAMRSLRERYDSGWLAEQIEDAKAEFLVAREIPTNEVVGFALASRQDPTQGHLLALAVDPARQNQRIGTALLRGVRENLVRQGALCLKLDVRADDVRARQFYQRHGFLPVGVQPKVYADGEDAVVMQRPL
jgi:[ribosomal protein S18]-alanine N-acetyltransferase